MIAAQASAKVSFRLVGDQNPAKIREAFRAYVRSKIQAIARWNSMNMAHHLPSSFL